MASRRPRPTQVIVFIQLSRPFTGTFEFSKSYSLKLKLVPKRMSMEKNEQEAPWTLFSFNLVFTKT